MRFTTFTAFLAFAIFVSGCDWMSQKLSLNKKQPAPIISPASKPSDKTQTASGGTASRPGQQASTRPATGPAVAANTSAGQTKQGPASTAATKPVQPVQAAPTKPATQPAGPKQNAATKPVKPPPSTAELAAQNNQYKLAGPDNPGGKLSDTPKGIDGPVSLTDLNSGSRGKTVETPNLATVNIDEGVPSATKPAQTQQAITIIAKTDAPPPSQPDQNNLTTQPVASSMDPSPEIKVNLATVGNETKNPKAVAKPDPDDNDPPEKEEPDNGQKIKLEIKPLPPAKEYTVNRTERINGVVMVINKQYITVGDLLAESHNSLMDIPSNASEDAFRSKASDILNSDLHRLATRMMLLNEAKPKLEDSDNDEIKKEMEDAERQLIAQYGTRSKLEQELASAGKTLEGVLQRHRDTLIIEKYLQRKLFPAIVINPRMLEEYYKKHQSEFSTPKKVQMQIIFVPFNKYNPKDQSGQPTQQELQAAREGAKKEIDEAAADLMSGTEFSEVAKKHKNSALGGEDGLWPLMEKGNFREQKVEDVAFALPEGKVSPVFDTDTGYYIVKARKVIEGNLVDYVEAQGTIQDKLRLEQFQKLSQKYYERVGRASVNSVIDDGFKLALDCAVERYFKK